MRKDIDIAMRKRNVQAVLVYGDTTLQNPDLTYVVGGALPRGGLYFKRVGEKPLLITSTLDIGLAKRYGVVRRLETYTQWGIEKLLKTYGRNAAFPRLIVKLLHRERVQGKVVLAGRYDMANGLNITDQLRGLGIRVSGEPSPSIIEAARETKEQPEVREIRAVAELTGNVMDRVVNALKRLKRKRAAFYLGGQKATVSLIKRLISTDLAQHDLIAPEGTIFSIGPSSAEGHNMGVPTDTIRPGKLIVFDIFPQNESGYWYDATRTYVLGRASRRALAMYEAVLEAQQDSVDFIREGITGEGAMKRACKVIEAHGYPTIRALYEGRKKSVPSGFTHSLGHGVGLTIGERPYLSFGNKERLKAGHIVTVEPGVYLPGYGGVRIEDTVLVFARGCEPLVKIEKELEIT